MSGEGSCLLYENQLGGTMGILKRIKQSFPTRKRVFEISSSNGLLNPYAQLRTRDEGGNPDPVLEARLAGNAQRLKEKRKIARLECEVVAPTARRETLRFPKKSSPDYA